MKNLWVATKYDEFGYEEYCVTRDTRQELRDWASCNGVSMHYEGTEDERDFEYGTIRYHNYEVIE